MSHLPVTDDSLASKSQVGVARLVRPRCWRQHGAGEGERSDDHVSHFALPSDRGQRDVFEAMRLDPAVDRRECGVIGGAPRRFREQPQVGRFALHRPVCQCECERPPDIAFDCQRIARFFAPVNGVAAAARRLEASGELVPMRGKRGLRIPACVPRASPRRGRDARAAHRWWSRCATNRPRLQRAADREENPRRRRAGTNHGGRARAPPGNAPRHRCILRGARRLRRRAYKPTPANRDPRWSFAKAPASTCDRPRPRRRKGSPARRSMSPRQARSQWRRAERNRVRPRHSGPAPSGPSRA